jgi:hypothetical protein
MIKKNRPCAVLFFFTTNLFDSFVNCLIEPISKRGSMLTLLFLRTPLKFVIQQVMNSYESIMRL